MKIYRSETEVRFSHTKSKSVTDRHTDRHSHLEKALLALKNEISYGWKYDNLCDWRTDRYQIKAMSLSRRSWLQRTRQPA